MDAEFKKEFFICFAIQLAIFFFVFFFVVYHKSHPSSAHPISFVACLLRKIGLRTQTFIDFSVLSFQHFAKLAFVKAGVVMAAAFTW